MAGLASGFHVYSSHLVTAGLRAESLVPSAHPRYGMAAVSSWLSWCYVAAHACSGCQGLHTRGDGTVCSSRASLRAESGGRGEPTSGPAFL